MEAVDAGTEMGDTQAGRVPYARAILGLCLGAAGWDDGDGSGDWDQEGGYRSIKGG